MPFVDTSILLYRVSTSPDETAKQAVAAELLQRDDLCLSVQVLQEFYTQATRVSRTNRLGHEDAVTLVQSWRRFPVQAITVELMDAAFVARERWGLSHWDAAIVAAAGQSNCETLYSEDLSHGQNYGRVTVINPFLTGI